MTRVVSVRVELEVQDDADDYDLVSVAQSELADDPGVVRVIHAAVVRRRVRYLP